jgi:dTDP-4-dehydrorhamnose reductase
MRILVTGAGGMLAQDVVRAAQYVNHELIALDHTDLDVTDARAVHGRIGAERPHAVINCAAYTDVDGAEGDPDGAEALNARGAKHVAAAAAEAGCRVVYPSTDYVFDGAKREPYVESDEAYPHSVYGTTKLAGERETAAATPEHFIVRSSWLFGSGGPNFVDTMLTLGRDLGEVLVVRDQVGAPTYTGHLADGIVRLVEPDQYVAFGVHHLAGYGECSRFEFAREIFRQAGIECRVMSCTTGEFPRPAPRPPYSVLASEREDTIYLPEWQEGLASYLAERTVAA